MRSTPCRFRDELSRRAAVGGGFFDVSLRRYVSVLMVVMCLFACGEHDECTSRHEQGIVVRSDGKQYDASNWVTQVVRVTVEGVEGDQFSARCSGALVGAAAVLTAAHCFPTSGVFAVAVTRPGSSVRCSVGRSSMSVEDVHIHSSFDAALLKLMDRAEGFTLLDGLPPVGAELVMAGFGLDAEGGLGDFVAASAKVERSADSIIVRGVGAGACIGDSGGPLVVADDSVPLLAGILSTGAASCAGRDYYVPVEFLKPWLAVHLPRAEFRRYY